MAQVSLGETFNASVEWTKTMFLKPFSFKKWVLLYIVAMLAFELQGGLNLRLNNSTRAPARETSAVSAANPTASSTVILGQAAAPVAHSKLRTYAPLFIGLGIIALFVFLLVCWLRAIFLFVFLESIANNDASIAKPFSRNRSIGVSYFAWSLLLMLLFLAVLAVPLKLGYDVLFRLGVIAGKSTASFGAILSAVVPHLLALVVLFIIGGLVGFFLEDYIVIVMYKDRVTLPKAMPSALRLVFSDPRTTIRYVVFKIGLAIALAIISAVVSFLVLVTFLAPLIILGIGLGFLYRVIPVPVRAIFFVILALFGVPIIAVIIFVTNVIYAPLAFFYRTFNMKFIARLDERYDLFTIA